MRRQTPAKGKANFYCMSDPWIRKYYRASIKLGDSEPNEGDLTYSDWIPMNPPAITHSMGDKTPVDVIWTTSLYYLLFSKRLLSILSANNIRGLGAYEVKFDGHDELTRNYKGIKVTKSVGVPEFSKVNMIKKIFPGGTMHFYRGFYFDEYLRGGNDIFRLEHPPTIIVTDTVKRLCIENEIKNIEFVNVTDFETEARYIKSEQVRG